MCDFHVNHLDFNAPQLPVSAVSDCKIDVPQASDSPTENNVASHSSLDNGLQDYTKPLPLEQQHHHLEDEERDGASDNESKPDDRVPEVLIPTNDTPDFLSRVLSGLSSQWMTLAMISLIFISIYLGLKALMMCVLCVQIKFFHQIVRIGYNVYRCYYIPWFRTLSWYILFCVIYFFYGETVMDYFFAPVQREEYVHMLSEYHPFISSALYLVGFCMFVLCLVKEQFRQPFYMFACTHVILLNVEIHSRLIIRDPYEWMMWFMVLISCIICNNIIGYMFGFFSGSTPLTGCPRGFKKY
ncbi:phosphatidate cytidylyltransferase 2-like [Pseudorasbora parva]|uniref:phosphatidate cytidylyltransferase 2-like n=1 Tax=Pseudorasbora parva TaxID=51549 RepID=UPI00351E6413